jgi:anti-sigma factor RsiW
MAHLSEGRLQAYLDGALVGGERNEVANHLAECTACEAELALLAGAAADFTTAVGVLDVTPPLERAELAMGWRRRGAERRGVGAARPYLRAAMLVLGFAATASAALPGSPLRSWAARAWQGAPAASPPTAAVPDLPAQVEADEPAGISILPREGEARVVITTLAPGGRVRVRLGEGSQVTLEASGGGEDARFRTAPGRIEAMGGGAGEFRIEAPRGARTTVEVAGVVVAIADQGVLRPAAGAELVGDTVVFPALALKR